MTGMDFSRKYHRRTGYASKHDHHGGVCPGWTLLLANNKKPNSLSLQATMAFVVIAGRNVILSFSRNYCSAAKDEENESENANAYEILGLNIDCTDADIKLAFRRLAKQTHPDLNNLPSARFVRILAAYEILSDPLKRAEYDSHLSFDIRTSQSTDNGRHTNRSVYENSTPEVFRTRQLEVVEWLAWYRYAINEIVSQKEIGTGSVLQEHLRGEFVSAVRAAFFGPPIESVHFLPDCFEAEERSESGISEILQLVSGRHLFGAVRFADKMFMLPNECSADVFYLHNPFTKGNVTADKRESSSGDANNDSDVSAYYNKENSETQRKSEASMLNGSDAYKTLELSLFGKVVAWATRIPPQLVDVSDREKRIVDCISIFMEVEDSRHNKQVAEMGSCRSERVLLGTIRGLGTAAPDGRCFVHAADGERTHMIMLHRTPLVKHMHWYKLEQNNAACECRCTRARLPPSKFWIFEPRCENHDIGGWYVETFGRDKKGRAVPMKRHYYSPNESVDDVIQGHLHPAVYLMGLAYRTLDLEASKAKKSFFANVIKTNINRRIISEFFGWCKSRFPSMKIF